MPANIIVGSQWGDEGKGKIIDIMASRAEVVIRATGGNNAGHTRKTLFLNWTISKAVASPPQI